MPFLPQDKERSVSDTSHAEKAIFFFKESPYISGANAEKELILTNFYSIS
jgi:hypothetical protein